ncbi:MAG: AAA family ATPase, partial [Candidatus Binatia bacterium]
EKIRVEEEWVWSVRGIEPLPYRLPELLAAPIDALVVIAEGEKDADVLARLGLVASTNHGGAGKWRPELNPHFRGRRVVVLADDDSGKAENVGLDHARDVARNLLPLAREVRLIERLPGVSRKGGDVSDWIAADGTREQLLELVAAAKPITPADVAEWSEAAAHEARRDAFTFTPVGTLLSEPERPVAWVVEGLLSASGLSALVAKPKVGKSTLARCFALAVARGGPVLGRGTAKGKVLYLALEESREQVRAHFLALGAADTDDIHVYAGRAPVEALLELRNAVAEHRPRLVVIDTLFRLTRVKDANDYAQVTAALDPLLALARELDTHVMFLHHSPKGDPRQAIEAALGSIAITGTVDIVIALRKTDRFRTIVTEQRE